MHHINVQCKPQEAGRVGGGGGGGGGGEENTGRSKNVGQFF